MCVPQLVAAQADRTPYAVAVTHGKLSLTYEELDKRADQLAHHLRSLGVGRNVIVGLYVGRSLAMVVGALGILKAGGAYLPLDPSDPARRLAFVLEDAQLSVLLAAGCMVDRLPAHQPNVITLDPEGRTAAPANPRRTVAAAHAQDLAYVIYTSGSTGRPKAAQIGHSNLSNLVLWHQQAFSVRPTDRASQLASPGFDAAVWEIWPYLAAGASLHVTDDATRSDPLALRDWLLKERITIAFVPTPLAERMLALEWPRETELRMLLIGGDTLHSYPPITLPFMLVNNYGPTECTVVATSGVVSPLGHPYLRPTIGRPISNVEVFILDERLQRVPVGVPGEVYIGGAAVGRGYLNSPQLTATKFMANPFGDKPNGRLYRTGDLARYLSDGQISFLGRIDNQIKIHGYRVEPDEIVAVLNEHPEVVASAVVAREAAGGDKYLVGYVVVSCESGPTTTSLKDFLRQRIPGYMVPSIFVRLESLPLSPSGKLDRGALPIPSNSNTLRDEPPLSVRTVVEARVAGILAEILGLEQVGSVDNFFLLGGHSLLATQIVTQVNNVFAVELTLRDVFEAPTVTELSEKVEQVLLAKPGNMSNSNAAV